MVSLGLVAVNKYQKKSEYSDVAKVGVNHFCEEFSKFKTQNFPEKELPYPRRLELSDMVSTSNDSQIAEIVSLCLQELECRVLGEHIAKANTAQKRLRIETLKQLIGKS